MKIITKKLREGGVKIICSLESGEHHKTIFLDKFEAQMLRKGKVSNPMIISPNESAALDNLVDKGLMTAHRPGGCKPSHSSRRTLFGDDVYKQLSANKREKFISVKLL